MKKIVRGNDFTLRVPMRKIVDGEAQKFPLPACEEVAVNLVNAYRRRALSFVISAEDDSLIEARVESGQLSLGSYALEVKGRLFGSAWRSNEYEQIVLVDNNAEGDTSFEPQEGEDSVEMDTAVVVLPPTAELGNLIDGAQEAIKKADEAKAVADVAAGNANKAASDAAQATTDAATATARANAAAARCEGMSMDFDSATGEIVISQ